MRPTVSLTTLSTIVLCGAASCAPASQEDPVSPSTGEEVTTEALQTHNDGLTYFAITADLRRCASPMCGGWYVTPLNRRGVECPDERFAERCYTPALDWSDAELSADEQATMLEACRRGAIAGTPYAIVRGRFEAGNATPMPELGRFVVDEAWVAANEAPADGVFVRVADNGLRCFTTPCPSLTEHTLNRRRTIDIAGIDWSPAALTDEELDACIERLDTPDGLIVAGHRTTIRGVAGTAPGRTATAAYLRLGTDAP
jgi:hypothetical protein